MHIAVTRNLDVVLDKDVILNRQQRLGAGGRIDHLDPATFVNRYILSDLDSVWVHEPKWISEHTAASELSKDKSVIDPSLEPRPRKL
jgi:thiamine pyrophosphokinase